MLLPPPGGSGGRWEGWWRAARGWRQRAACRLAQAGPAQPRTQAHLPAGLADHGRLVGPLVPWLLRPPHPQAAAGCSRNQRQHPSPDDLWRVVTPFPADHSSATGTFRKEFGLMQTRSLERQGCWLTRAMTPMQPWSRFEEGRSPTGSTPCPRGDRARCLEHHGEHHGTMHDRQALSCHSFRWLLQWLRLQHLAPWPAVGDGRTERCGVSSTEGRQLAHGRAAHVQLVVGCCCCSSACPATAHPHHS